MASPSGERGSSPFFPSQEAFSQAATSMLRQLHELTCKMDSVRTLNPLGALRQLKRLDAGLQALKPEFFRCFEHSYVEMSTHVTVGNLAAPVVQLNQLADSLPFFLRLQSSWARVQAAIEYKPGSSVGVPPLREAAPACHT